MEKNSPFQQFMPPKPKAMTGRWFRRHIVIDHRHKEILIQIMWDGSGELNVQEYQDIAKGAWWSLVPKARVDEYRGAIASGYKVLPVVVAGGNDGEDHLCMQLIELTNTRNVVSEQMEVVPE